MRTYNGGEILLGPGVYIGGMRIRGINGAIYEVSPGG